MRGELWVTTEDSVLRLAPRSGKLLGRFALDSTLGEAGAAGSVTVTAGDSHRLSGRRMIWVTNKERSLVYRIHPAMFSTPSPPALARSPSRASPDRCG